MSKPTTYPGLVETVMSQLDYLIEDHIKRKLASAVSNETEGLSSSLEMSTSIVSGLISSVVRLESELKETKLRLASVEEETRKLCDYVYGHPLDDGER